MPSYKIYKHLYGIFGVDRKQMQAVEGKQEIYLEWPNLGNIQEKLAKPNELHFPVCILNWQSVNIHYKQGWQNKMLCKRCGYTLNDMNINFSHTNVLHSNEQ